MARTLLTTVGIAFLLVLLLSLVFIYGWRLNTSAIASTITGTPGETVAIRLTKETISAPIQKGTFTLFADGTVELSGLFLQDRQARSGLSPADIDAAQNQAEGSGLLDLFFANRAVCLDAFTGTIAISIGLVTKQFEYAACPTENANVAAFRSYLIDTFTQPKGQP